MFVPPRTPTHCAAGYEPFTHPQLQSVGHRGEPSLIVWGNREGTSDGIAALDISYEEKVQYVVVQLLLEVV